MWWIDSGFSQWWQFFPRIPLKRVFSLNALLLVHKTKWPNYFFLSLRFFFSVIDFISGLSSLKSRFWICFCFSGMFWTIVYLKGILTNFHTLTITTCCMDYEVHQILFLLTSVLQELKSQVVIAFLLCLVSFKKYLKVKNLKVLFGWL